MGKVKFVLTDTDGNGFLIFFEDGKIAVTCESGWSLYENGEVIERTSGAVMPASQHYKSFENGEGEVILVPEPSTSFAKITALLS